MLGFLSLVVMLIVAYSFLQEGVLTAFMMLCNVFVAGLVAFDLWEPCAVELGPTLAGTFLAGYEDCFCLVLLFSLTLGLLRWTTNNLANIQPDYHPILQQGGAALFGLLTGYLIAGFLICVLQTLPWHENFMGFDPRVEDSGSKLRRVLPPDRVWLALMHRASTGPFSQSGEPTFDPGGSFEMRYARLRRYRDQEKPAAQ